MNHDWEISNLSWKRNPFCIPDQREEVLAETLRYTRHAMTLGDVTRCAREDFVWGIETTGNKFLKCIKPDHGTGAHVRTETRPKPSSDLQLELWHTSIMFIHFSPKMNLMWNKSRRKPRAVWNKLKIYRMPTRFLLLKKYPKCGSSDFVLRYDFGKWLTCYFFLEISTSPSRIRTAVWTPEPLKRSVFCYFAAVTSKGGQEPCVWLTKATLLMIKSLERQSASYPSRNYLSLSSAIDKRSKQCLTPNYDLKKVIIEEELLDVRGMFCVYSWPRHCDLYNYLFRCEIYPPTFLQFFTSFNRGFNRLQEKAGMTACLEWCAALDERICRIV